MVDPAYYKDNWHGSFDGSEEELRILLSRAADAVNIAITMSGYTVHTVPDMVAENVKKAVCAQADYIEAQGGVSCMADAGSVVSATIGKFSYQSGASGSAAGSMLCSLTNSDLEKGHLVWKTPYARHLYYGIIMVDPKTGKACFPIGDQLYSRKGVKKVKSNREFRFAGRGRKLWAQAAAAQHKEDWKAVYEAALKGAMQK